MALSPISIFRNDQSSLAQLLQGGNQTITGIMDQAIQIGRDMSNKQLAQEQDMLAMRRNETALAQRRGEELQQNIEDAQRFARSAYEFDTKFGQDQANTQFSQERATAQDIFGNAQEERRTVVSEKSLGLREADAQAERAKEERIAIENAKLAQGAEGSAPAPAAQETQAPVSPVTLFSPGEKPRASGDYINKGLDQMTNVDATKPAAPPATTTATPAPATQTPDSVKLAGEVGVLRERLAAAKKTGNAQLVIQRARELEEKEQVLKNMPSASNKDPRVGERADKRLAMSEEALAQKKAREGVETDITGDTAAFVPPKTWMTKAFGLTDDGKSIKGITPEQMAEAEAYEKDPVAVELGYAKNHSNVETYVNAVKGLTEAQKEKRRRVWMLAHSATATSGTEDDPVKSAIEGL